MSYYTSYSVSNFDILFHRVLWIRSHGQQTSCHSSFEKSSYLGIGDHELILIGLKFYAHSRPKQITLFQLDGFPKNVSQLRGIGWGTRQLFFFFSPRPVNSAFLTDPKQHEYPLSIPFAVTWVSPLWSPWVTPNETKMRHIGYNQLRTCLGQ